MVGAVDLTSLAGAPPAAGDPPGFAFDDDTMQYVDYRGADGDIHQLFWSGAWQVTDLTTATDGAPAATGDAYGYVFEPQPSLHVDFHGVDGDIYEFWWDGTNWLHADLSATGGGAPPPAGALRGYAFNSDGTQHVDYRGLDGDIHELWWGGSWAYDDLSASAGGAPAAAGDPSGYAFEAEGTQHVYYRGVDGDVHELLWDGAWHHTDLTATVSGAPQAAGDPHAYMFDAQGSQHVDYLGVDGDVHELWWSPSGWAHVDLTGAAGGAPAPAGDPFGFASNAQYAQHVDYRGADGDVHELCWDNAGWHAIDLTTASGGAPATAGDPFGYAFDAQGSVHVDYRGVDGDVHELWW